MITACPETQQYLEYDRANIPPALTNIITYNPLTDNNITILIQQKKYLYINPRLRYNKQERTNFVYKQRFNCFHISYRNRNICTLQVLFILYRDKYQSIN